MNKKVRIILSLCATNMAIWQLCGCAATSQNEMLQMIDSQQVIAIEISEPINQEQGEEKQLEWIELALLQTYPEFRDVFEDTLSITAHGTNGKNGIVYVDLEGNHTNNSTLFYAFSNKKFLDNFWNNSENVQTIINATKENYADVNTDAESRLAALNAYFNIFNDAEPSYFNGNSTLTRAEFYGGVYRAANPVSDIAASAEFLALVDPASENDETAFASQIQDDIYLDVESKSINQKTFAGSISRAEAVYTLVKLYYNDAYEATTGKETCYSDAKNGGDIATKQKFIVTDKETDVVTKKTFWKSYELSYALQNPDKGMPTDLYKALVVAKEKGLINGTESRWDEAITKREALDMLVTIFLDKGTVTNADRGASEGENLIQNEAEQVVEDFVVEDMEPTTMYVKEKHFAKAGPHAEDFADESYVLAGDVVSVIGVVKSYKGEECLWYTTNLGIFIPAEYLTTEQPAPSTEAPTVTETPAAGEVVGEDPLADLSDEDIQSIFDQVAGSGNSNSGGGDGGLYFENNPDWVGGGKGPDGVSGW